MAAPLPGDKRAGFMGLIIGGIAVFLIAWGIVHLTNKKYEGEEKGGTTTEQPAADQSATQQPPTQAQPTTTQQQPNQPH